MGQRSQMYVSFNNGSRANMTKLEFECEIKKAMNKKKRLVVSSEDPPRHRCILRRVQTEVS